MIIERNDALKFNEMIGDSNPIHDEHSVVPGMLLYGIAAHFLDSPANVATFKKMVKYGEPVEIRTSDGVRIYKQGVEVFNLIGEQNIQGNHYDEHYDNMEHVGEIRLDVLEFFDDYFKKVRPVYYIGQNDYRAALACMAVGALAKEFYERENGLVILRYVEFEFLSGSIDKKKKYDLYKSIERRNDGRSGTIYVKIVGDEPVARGKIHVYILGNHEK